MDQQTLLGRCQRLTAAAASPPWTAEDAIGFFQGFRPDGAGLQDLFEGVPHGDELQERLRRVFAASGESLRPDGMRDAYFIVRHPSPLDPAAVEQAGRQWLQNLAQLDRHIGDGSLSAQLDPLPQLRVLEGKPPKHPRNRAERPRLLNEIQAFSERFVVPLEPDGDAALGLRRAYYFIACDAYLRDHLLWPLYRQLAGMADPLEPYFTLWEHGIKFRVFNDKEIDLYIPRAIPQGSTAAAGR